MGLNLLNYFILEESAGDKIKAEIRELLIWNEFLWF